MSHSGQFSMATIQVYQHDLFKSSRALTRRTGCTTSILGYPAFIEYFNLDAVTIGAFASAYYGGGFVGSISNYWIPDWIGRLRTIQLSCVLSLIGVALQTGAQTFPVFCAGRVIGGIACGIVFSICPTYASEISPPELRGRVGGLYAFNVNFAYMLTEWSKCNISVEDPSDRSQWALGSLFSKATLHGESF